MDLTDEQIVALGLSPGSYVMPGVLEHAGGWPAQLLDLMTLDVPIRWCSPAMRSGERLLPTGAPSGGQCGGAERRRSP